MQNLWATKSDFAELHLRGAGGAFEDSHCLSSCLKRARLVTPFVCRQQEHDKILSRGAGGERGGGGGGFSMVNVSLSRGQLDHR